MEEGPDHGLGDGAVGDDALPQRPHSQQVPGSGPASAGRPPPPGGRRLCAGPQPPPRAPGAGCPCPVRPPARRWCPNPWRYPGQSPLVLACPYPRSLSCGLSHAKSIAQAERGFPTKYGKASRVLQGFLGGVRQKAAATTCRAPAWRRVRAASFRVAPVVRMSSRRRIRCPATWAGWGAV